MEKAQHILFTVLIFDNGKDQVSLDMTKKGGYPIWLINHREIGEQKISLNEAASKAEEYLQAHHFMKICISMKVYSMIPKDYLLLQLCRIT